MVSDWFLDQFLSQLKSNLDICCPANPSGLTTKSDLFTEVTQRVCVYIYIYTIHDCKRSKQSRLTFTMNVKSVNAGEYTAPPVEQNIHHKTISEAISLH